MPEIQHPLAVGAMDTIIYLSSTKGTTDVVMEHGVYVRYLITRFLVGEGGAKCVARLVRCTATNSVVYNVIAVKIKFNDDALTRSHFECSRRVSDIRGI